MGLVSSDLQNIVNQLDKAKNSINNKYDIMRNNNANAQEDISHLYIDELSPSIDKIECLNSYDSELEPDKILEGTKFYSKGQPLIGTMPNNEAQNIILNVDHISEGIALGYHNGTGTANIILQEKECIPGISDQNITPDTNKVLSKVTVKGDSNLSSENIKPGVSIFNVTGSGEIKQLNSLLYEEKSELKIPSGWYQDSEVKIQTQEKTCKPNNTLQIIEPDDEHVLSRVFVEGDEDLIPENIKKGINIFGVIGNMKEYSDYNIVYVVNQSKHIAYKQKVAYDKSFNIISDIPNPLYDEEFKGWSTDPSAISPMYTSNQQISIPLADIGETAILYAVWEELPLNDISITLNYANGGKLSNGYETVTATISNGNYGKGYTNINRIIDCNTYSKDNFKNETDTSYKCVLKFNELGFYPLVVIHTTKSGKQLQATEVIKIAGEGGKMTGSGNMVANSNGTWFDSKWFSVSIPKGCYVKSFTYKFKTSGHSSTFDSFAVFGKKSNGAEILLYDFGNSSNIGKTVDLTNLGTAVMVQSGYLINIGDINLTQNDLSNISWNIQKIYNISDDIRQVRFFAYSNHTSTCITEATIDFDIQYEFDMDLYESDKNR